MSSTELQALTASVARIETVFSVGRVARLNEATISVSGLSVRAALGDMVDIRRRSGHAIGGEIIQLGGDLVDILPTTPLFGVSVGDRVLLRQPAWLAPHDSWIGRVIDPFGAALDGRPILSGVKVRPLQATAPPATERRRLGPRLETGLAAFNTFLPIVRGQRIGLFSGSGVGKSTLLAGLARGLDADVVVVGLVGERGREVRHFVDTVLGPRGMARAVVVAATSDQGALARRRCAWSAMAVAEYFRDQGLHVLVLMDSITRFAEAHREIAAASGEPGAQHGMPPSLSHQIMALAERAGPGTQDAGDITAVFSVLVAGSDMDGPVADILRGVLDGHVVLDRSIAERGRFPAIDLLRSVSRSLPDAASDEENRVLALGRSLLGAYDRAELMIQSGLYQNGSDPLVDQAIACWQGLDRFLAATSSETVADSFARLNLALSGA
ncbi:FliI/YscN family ATPase [Pseudoruegeria sp. SK021]|uniref:FliI/YscN family ATPase n=1 Tax=Pseudoruegeria sp. SK021 TaxID=1933035 RepID=UPI000A24428E|nr:FliI/YscN family ATPase [Pseudoruegeria sp. SK021]OSP54743.1 flagellum-specific ATP synthase FliI [Pseudoruegeria sp. SK021]